MQQIHIFMQLVRQERIIFGQTIEFINKCNELNISTKIDDKLKKLIHPNLYISNIEPPPNKNYQYRDYQARLLQSLCINGRGVIISPTRSGKSLILARIMS